MAKFCPNDSAVQRTCWAALDHEGRHRRGDARLQERQHRLSADDGGNRAVADQHIERPGKNREAHRRQQQHRLGTDAVGQRPGQRQQRQLQRQPQTVQRQRLGMGKYARTAPARC